MFAKKSTIRTLIIALAASNLVSLPAFAQQKPPGTAPEKIAPAGPVTPPLIDAARVKEMREQAVQLSNLRQEQALIEAQAAVAKARADLAKQRSEILKAEKDPLGTSTSNPGSGVPNPQMGQTLPNPGQGVAAAPVASPTNNKLTLLGTQGQPGQLTATLRQGDTLTNVGVGDEFDGWQVADVSLMSVRLVQKNRGKAVATRILRVENPVERSPVTSTNAANGVPMQQMGGYPGGMPPNGMMGGGY